MSPEQDVRTIRPTIPGLAWVRSRRSFPVPGRPGNRLQGQC
jgi:hypothetical protein